MAASKFTLDHPKDYFRVRHGFLVAWGRKNSSSSWMTAKLTGSDNSSRLGVPLGVNAQPPLTNLWAFAFSDLTAGVQYDVEVRDLDTGESKMAHGVGVPPFFDSGIDYPTTGDSPLPANFVAYGTTTDDPTTLVGQLTQAGNGTITGVNTGDTRPPGFAIAFENVPAGMNYTLTITDAAAVSPLTVASS